MTKKLKAWDGKWFNTVKGRSELLVQCTMLVAEMDALRERMQFLRALTLKAVAALQGAERAIKHPTAEGTRSASCR